MPIDWELPNGVVIEGVPEGTSKHSVAMKAISKGWAKPEDFGYENVDAADPSTLENLRAGVGRGLVEAGTGLARTLLPKSLEPEFLDDTERDRLAEDLDKTKAGLTGRIIGNVAGTAPIAGGAGSLVAKGASTLASKASRVPTYLPRTLQRGAGRAAVEGGVASGVLGENPLQGAAFGGALGAAGTGLGKVLGRGKLTAITDEAKKLQKMTGGKFIPLSHSAENDMVRMVYNALLANLPGSARRVRGQYKEALDDVRRLAAEYAHPPRANITINPDDDLAVIFGKLEDYWDTAFDDIKVWPFKIFKQTPINAPRWMDDALSAHTGGVVRIPKVGQTVDGSDILELKTALGELMRGAGSLKRGQIKRVLDEIEEVMNKNLNPSGKYSGQAGQILKDYEEAAHYWPVWKGLEKAARKASQEEFSPKLLERHVKTGISSTTKSESQILAETAANVLENFPSREGIYQLVAAGSLAAGGVAGLMGGASAVVPFAVPFAIAVGLARLGASKGLQRYLSGQTKLQATNKRLLDKYSKELQRLGFTARQSLVMLGVEDGS